MSAAALAAQMRMGLFSDQLLAFAHTFIDRIEEDGEPTPGTRWHAEYVEAKRLVAAIVGEES